MRQKKGSDIHGILLLDKPIGMTSNATLQRVKRLYGAKKVGHTGCLDPLVSGMLPLCFGEATKFSRFFLEATKCYHVTMQLGARTSTGDTDGEIVEEAPLLPISEDKITALLSHFLGELQQIPPMYSAIKIDGQRLYKLARRGKTVERAPRAVTIHRLSLDDVSEHSQGRISFTVECSKGTYIRTLVEDMGAYLGNVAHVHTLRRAWVHPFRGYATHTLNSLIELPQDERERCLHKTHTILNEVLPCINVPHVNAQRLLSGLPIALGEIQAKGWVTLMNADQFLGVGEILEEVIVPRRLIHQPPEKPQIPHQNEAGCVPPF